MDEAKAVFEQALMRLAPNRAREAAEALPFLRNDETFRRGTKDGDLYMGWALLHLAPERDGQAALQRFFERLREVASPPKAQPATDRPSPLTGGGGERSGTRGSVRWTDWQAEDKSEGFDGPARQDIRRTYTFSGMNVPESESAATLTIVCELEATLMPDGESISLDRKLRFYLRPFRLPHEAEFVMRLATRDEAQGGEFDVVAGPAEAGGNTAIIAKYGGRNDVATCVATLRSSRDMVFMLRDQRESLVNFLLPNDGAFQRLYDETVGRLQQRAVTNQVLRSNAELQRGQRTRPDPQTTVQVSNESTVLAQLPEVEAALGRCVVEFQDRTKLHYILIFPIMHKVALKLYVEDFGVEKALKIYENMVAILTSDGTLREGQFKSFGWPEVPPHEAPRAQELDALLWRFVRDLIGRGILKETIASALVNVASKTASKMAPLVAAGFVMTALKELRAGLHTPPPEIRPEATEDTDELTTLIFNQLRDVAYTLKDGLGLEWQLLLPGMQRVCVICSIKFQGRDGALALFREQVLQLEPVLDQCQKNPPQQLPLTPLHIKNRSVFNEQFEKLADIYIEEPDVHPAFVAKALSMLITKLASTHYDLTYLSGILSSSCADIEQGKYDFVRKTH